MTTYLESGLGGPDRNAVDLRATVCIFAFIFALVVATGLTLITVTGALMDPCPGQQGRGVTVTNPETGYTETLCYEDD